MAQIRFFATRDDLEKLLERFEQSQPVSYWATDEAGASKAMSWNRGHDLPALGAAEGTSTPACRSFLVRPVGMVPVVRRVRQDAGSVVSIVDQLENDASAVFTPAGRYNALVMLPGTFGSVWDDPDSKALLRGFSGALRKTFSKVRAYWVGPEALAALHEGIRLTISPHAAPEFDLVA
jgi:hypothetical protein